VISTVDPGRPLAELPLIGFDTETTGLSAATERVVELAAVRVEAGRRDEFSFLLDPGIPIPEGARRVHGISDAMVAGKPSLERVLPDFLEFIAGGVLVAHNAPFDIGFLAVGLQRAGLPLIDAPVLDSLELARSLLPGPVNYKLETLVRFLRLPAHDAHRALGDAAACLEITRRCIAQRDGLTDAPLSKTLAIGAARPGFAAFDPAAAKFPARLEPLRAALLGKQPVRLSVKIFGRADQLAGVPAAYCRDERAGADWIVMALQGGGEKAVRLDHITALETS
jgi:DNA polymerase-3 subunit epsilon